METGARPQFATIQKRSAIMRSRFLPSCQYGIEIGRDRSLLVGELNVLYDTTTQLGYHSRILGSSGLTNIDPVSVCKYFSW